MSDFEPLDSLVLRLVEAKTSFINRHLIADIVESEFDPLKESDGCSNAIRRKYRMGSIGRYATIRECAKFLANNKFSTSQLKYEKREVPLNEEDLYEKMKASHAKISRHIRNS